MIVQVGFGVVCCPLLYLFCECYLYHNSQQPGRFAVYSTKMLTLHLPCVAALSLTSGKPGGVAVGVFTSDVCVGHDTGWFCPESPKRLEKQLADLRTEWQAEFIDLLQMLKPEVDVR